MKIFISGQKQFAADVFRLCVKLGHTIVGVCAPVYKDREDALHQIARLNNVPILPAGSLTYETLPDGIDLGITAHSHDFIGKLTRYKVKHGWIGYHPSLLPIHRGRDAIRWALKTGDRVTGGSIYWLDGRVDGGDLAAQDYVLIHPKDTAETLWREKLQALGHDLFRRVLPLIEAGTCPREPQDEAMATWEPSLDPPALRRPDLKMLPAPGESL